MTALGTTTRTDDLDRAGVIRRTACRRLREGKVAAAAALHDFALDLCLRSDLPCERLQLEILQARAECHETARDHGAAAADLELAFELADRIGDRHGAADACSRSATALESAGDGVRARFYAELARTFYVQLEDWPSVGRLLTMLGRLPLTAAA